MQILGIESSCDETGLAIYDAEQGIIAFKTYSQIALHQPYGGVVPELASRDHIQKTLPLLEQLCEESNIKINELNGIAYTAGPGLIGALLVGTSIAQGLGFALNIPTIGVHHMEGHLLAPMLEDPAPTFPFLALLVSGGHTLLVKVAALGDYEVLGESIDDAVGEAFDKTAKLLGLGYPGGPEIARLAEQGRPGRFTFPRPMTQKPGLDFSFSGLKTHSLQTLKKTQGTEQDKADIAHAFQEAAIDTLAIKCQRAMMHSGLSDLVAAGGVSANHLLRERLSGLCQHEGGRAYFPRPAFCADNGAMIAYAGYLRLAAGQRDAHYEIGARARWPMSELKPPISTT